jgi:putative membrane protein
MQNKFLAASAAACLALAACGGGGESDTNAANDLAMNDMAMEDLGNGTNAAAPAAAMSGQDYATQAAASDLFEIQSAQLAGEKASAAGVKELAQMILKDHQKSTADLKTAAQQAQPPITVNPQLDAEQQANMEALRGASGEQFDRLYLQQQVAAHQKALTLVQNYAATGDVDSLKQHASTVSGPIQQHLERAQQLSQQ